MANPAMAPLVFAGPPGWLAIGALTLVTAGVWMMSGDDESDTFSDTAPPPENCPTCDIPPECAAITAEIRRLTEEVRFRHGDLLTDRHRLYDTARRIRDAGPYGSWQGHLDRFASDKNLLRTEIAFAMAKGCPVDPEAIRVSDLLAPSRPG